MLSSLITCLMSFTPRVFWFSDVTTLISGWLIVWFSLKSRDEENSFDCSIKYFEELEINR